MSAPAIPWQAHFDGEAPVSLDIVPQSLQDYLDRAADEFGNRKAIIFQNMTMTYRQLRDKAEAVAASLRERGLQSGDRVAIMLPNLPQTVIAFWGALKAGAVVVMTNPLYMEKELTHHFSDSKPKFLITLDLFWNKLKPLRDQLGIETYVISRLADGLAFPLNLLQPIQAKRQGDVPQVEYDGKSVIPWKSLVKTRKRYSEKPADPQTALALLQYTGGTTGFSKGAMLTHYNLQSQIQQLLSIIRGDAATTPHVFIGVMPFFHVYGLMGSLMLPTIYASPTIPIPRYVPRDLLEMIKKHRPTFFVGAPAIYISLMQQKNIEEYDLTCIQLCISGSSPFPLHSMRRFQEMTKAKITEGFGLTEASPVVIANPLHGRQKDGSIGVPITGTEACIVDLEKGSDILPPNQIGELIVRGPQVMLGYWNHPEETAVTIRNGWLYTGDIAYQDEDGYFYIVDRKKDMAIVGGYNVFPSEIDEVLHEYPKIQEAVALSVPHRSKGETLKAYVVPKPGEKITVAELVAHCRQKLASYKVPRMFEFREELPKSMVGKVLRRALRDEEAKKQAGEADTAVEDRATAEAPQATPTPPAASVSDESGALPEQRPEMRDGAGAVTENSLPQPVQTDEAGQDANSEKTDK